MASPAPILFGDDGEVDDSKRDVGVFGGLPPELVEMIIDRLWRLEDQLLCRRVCKWWGARVGMPVRYNALGQPERHYSLTPTMWATLGTDNRSIRTMRFDPQGATHLWEYSADGHRVDREVVFRPPDRVTEILHEHDRHRRFITTWHVRARVAKHDTFHDAVQCSIL